MHNKFFKHFFTAKGGLISIFALELVSCLFKIIDAE